MCQNIDFPHITKDVVEECLNEIPIEVDRQFITEFIVNYSVIESPSMG